MSQLTLPNSSGLERRKPAYLLVGIVVLALAIRLVFSLAIYPRLAGPLGLGQDPDYFGQLALNWVSGHGYVLIPVIRLRLFVGLAIPCCSLRWALSSANCCLRRSLQSLLGALLCLPVFYIGWRVGAAIKELASG